MPAAPRRSSRQSTPVNSPPPTHAKLPGSASTPSIASLAAPTSIRKSASSRALSPAPMSARPSLPTKDANVEMKNYTGKLHKVKLQVLALGGQSDEKITIARVKCPVPKGVPGHIIKRFDTGAVSASSLFRAAFPTASEQDEVKEMNWISTVSRGRYGDTKAAGVEDNETRKLSGTWIPAEYANGLAKEYKIERFAVDLIAHKEKVEVVEIVDSEAESPAVRSPRSKRVRVNSPPITSPTSISGASTSNVSILQTLATDAKSGLTTETTEVKVDVPISSAAGANGLVASDAQVAQQIKEAQALVEKLKEDGTLKEMTDETTIVPSASKKRALEADEDETAVAVDTRGFFGKIFKRAPARSKAPITASREIKPLGSQVAVVDKQEVQGEGRRWIAGFGLAVAVGATAAAPYLFG